MLEALLGQPVAADPATLEIAIREGRCSAIAFDLYKEAGTVVIAVSSLGPAPSGILPRDQAICAGLPTRIGKFMLVVAQLSAADGRREVVMALSRSILESSVNLRYLLTRADATVFDAFVKASLGPERELYDVIQGNIVARRGQRLPIEERMLRSIDRTLRLSGFTIDEVSPRPKGWAGTLRDRMKAIDEEDLYLPVQRVLSHAVHGSWVDLLLHHLDEHDDGFIPDYDLTSVDARLLTPVALLVLRAVDQYVRQYFSDTPDCATVPHRVVDLGDRIARTDSAHEAWMSRRHDAEAEPPD